jgi:hypothetical protein
MAPRSGLMRLKAIALAFDEAWAQITAFFGNDPVMIESARLTLPVPS